MLSKPLGATHHPAIAEVPFVARYTQCGPTPAPGYWQRNCGGTWVPAGYQCSNGGVTSPSHDHSGEPVIYQFLAVGPCHSEFVQTGPPGPVVCTTYPEQPHRPASPAWTERFLDFGWNSGANSIDELDGDFVIRDTMDRVVGVTWGIVPNRGNVSDPARITHGFMFTQSQSGVALVAVVEAGRTVVPSRPYDPGDEFAIVRVASQVAYSVNQQTIYRSVRTSEGLAMVGCVLYSSGDQIP